MLIQNQGFLTFNKARGFVVSVLRLAIAGLGGENQSFLRVLVDSMNHSWESVGELNSCSKAKFFPIHHREFVL